jgi:hypothetical protein
MDESCRQKVIDMGLSVPEAVVPEVRETREEKVAKLIDDPHEFEGLKSLRTCEAMEMVQLLLGYFKSPDFSKKLYVLPQRTWSDGTIGKWVATQRRLWAANNLPIETYDVLNSWNLGWILAHGAGGRSCYHKVQTMNTNTPVLWGPIEDSAREVAEKRKRKKLESGEIVAAKIQKRHFKKCKAVDISIEERSKDELESHQETLLAEAKLRSSSGRFARSGVDGSGSNTDPIDLCDSE